MSSDNKDFYGRTLWAVVVEPDGGQLPSWYYRRLRELSLTVEGDRELGPLARRYSGHGAVVMQEGIVITTSETLARQVVWLAMDAFDKMEEGGQLEGRKPLVSMGRMKLEEGLYRTKQDADIMDRIEGVLSRPGRKPAAKLWAVSCMECCQVTGVKHWSPINCANCGGVLIHSRPGSPLAYKDPGGDILMAWQRTRFQGAHWEPAPISDHGADVPDLYNPPAGREEETVDLLHASPALLDAIRAMPREIAFDFLDAVFATRTYRTAETRLALRAETVTNFFQQGGSPANVDLIEPAGRLDLIYAAPVLGHDNVVAWLMAQQRGSI